MPAPPNLLRSVLIDGQRLRLPVAKDLQARAKAMRGEPVRYDLTRVMLHGVPTVVTSGMFYIEYREDGRKVRRAIGEHPTEVKAALATQTSVLDLRARGVAADDAPQLRPRIYRKPEGKTVRQVVEEFVKNPPLEYRRRTYLKYRNALECFLEWLPARRKAYCVEIERDDIKAFLMAEVRERKLDVSTAIDKAVVVCKILRDQGAPIAMKKGDWPKVTERQPEIYRPEMLKALFKVCDPDDYCLYQTFLMTGMREAEVSHLWWTDVDLARGTVRVSKKPGFDPKSYQERTVPVPEVLVELLDKHRARHAVSGARPSRLVFPTSASNTKKGAPGGQSDGHMLRRLKLLAHRAGLNCGRCAGVRKGKRVTCAAAPMCQEFGLHKFRHTYATTLLRDGVDLVSLQKLLGHADLDSTKKYLRALEPDDLLAKVRATTIATRFV